ncbi:hypothetical protein Ocin01_13196 [Orchesella cincta]|uniref:Uncharacterized protein n=1 Tax=Orchesella cincta TaxID=48709 RepID=A0A1D2MKQ6_ORCCI|nr:hypothetical protein Ocin01_13196 [Orchesella cincta]
MMMIDANSQTTKPFEHSSQWPACFCQCLSKHFYKEKSTLHLDNHPLPVFSRGRSSVVKMFLFSKKLMYLLIIVTLVFGVDRCNAEGLWCWACDDTSNPPCSGGGEVECKDSDPACEVRKEGGKLIMSCVGPDIWKGADGKLKETIPGVACWCNDQPRCNRNPAYCSSLKEDGLIGTTRKGDNDVSTEGESATSSGTVGTIISPGLAILFWFLVKFCKEKSNLDYHPIQLFRGRPSVVKGACQNVPALEEAHIRLNVMFVSPAMLDGSGEESITCPNGDYACGAIKSGDTITKRCSKDETEWRDSPGSNTPKDKKGEECWCRDNNCNGPTFCGFNVDGGSGGNGTGTGGGGGSGSSGGDVGDSLTSGAVESSFLLAWLFSSGSYKFYVYSGLSKQQMSHLKVTH